MLVAGVTLQVPIPVFECVQPGCGWPPVFVRGLPAAPALCCQTHLLQPSVASAPPTNRWFVFRAGDSFLCAVQVVVVKIRFVLSFHLKGPACIASLRAFLSAIYFLLPAARVLCAGHAIPSDHARFDFRWANY